MGVQGLQDCVPQALHDRAAQEAQRGAEGQVQGLHERIAALERQISTQQVPTCLVSIHDPTPLPLALWGVCMGDAAMPQQQVCCFGGALRIERA